MSLRTGAATLSLLLLAGACGDRGGDGSATSDTSTPPSSAATEADGAAKAAFGVSEESWPSDLAGAEALFERMPATLGGADLRHPKFFGGADGVAYGPQQGDSTPTAWVMEAGEEVPDATAALSVMFGMTLACKRDTYRGTAPQSRWGGGPEADPGDRYPTDELWWFSCTIDGAEGAPNFTGHAVGWASGDLGWLVTTPDRATTKAMTEALIAAN